MSSQQTYEPILLTLSNVFFLLPIISAFRQKMVYEGLIYVLTMLTSIIYHYDFVTDDECLTHFSLCLNPTMKLLDRYYACSTIVTTVIIWIHSADHVDHPDQHDQHDQHDHQSSKVIVNTFGTYLILLLILEDVNFIVIIMILIGYCSAYLLIAIFGYSIPVWRCNYLNFVGAMIFIPLGITFYYLSEIHLFLHIFWHLCIAIGIALILESHGTPPFRFMENSFMSERLCQCCRSGQSGHRPPSPSSGRDLEVGIQLQESTS